MIPRNGNPAPKRVAYQYANSVYGAELPQIMAMVGPGYRFWEFQFGMSGLSYLTPGFFSDAAALGMQVLDIIIIQQDTPTAVIITDVTMGGAATVSTDVVGMLTLSRTQINNWSPSYGDLISNWTGSVTFGGVGVLDDSNPCPDKAQVSMLNAKYPGVAVDPAGNSTVTGLNIPCNTVENVVVWMKGTARGGDQIAQAYPFYVYLGVGGFTKNANLIALLPPDGEWHPLIMNKNNFGTAGGFSFDSADIITTIRVRPTDPSQNGTVGYNTATTGEVNICGPIRLNPRARPKLVIRFDDSINDLVQPNPTVNFTLPDGTTAPSQGWSALTLLSHYGFRGSCFHLPRRIGTSNNIRTHATWDDLKVLKQNGWANCFQSYYDPLDTANNGIRLLGPFGYAARSIASVDAAADTITATIATSIPLATTVYGGYPILFSGTNLPAPLVINKIYWAAGVSATAFKLYPTELDAINGTNIIDLTTTGTAANFTYRYGFSANDYTKYTEDWTLGMRLLTDNGYGDDAKFLALNQGATDGNVMTLAPSSGIKAIFGTYKGSTPGWFMAAYPWTENGGTNPALNWKKIMRLPAALQTDSAGLISAQNARDYVDSVVAQGSWGMNYHHVLTNPNGACLAAYLDQAKMHSDAGRLDVITAPELPLA